jgi:hypothetical protein
MKSNKVDDLVKELQLSKTGIGWTVAGEENKKDVEIIIRRFFSEIESENSKLIMQTQAKLEVYEKLISISNFAPMLENKLNTNLP